ncbi:MAG: flavodoxin-dependent (E)-4-hydroxy-3-methylbut-2-enyl-diphosphate synthase [Deltaproteobacteria bacterium]|nr:MAG: flavodoxin-dependent (E)-4-hydroxy-3-methylbut-2-enyl-diphosphate synthase [Deltaproteobacteria bacterium]
MGITRRKTRQIHVGPVPVGGDAPVVVQSMCTTDTRDIPATLEQIRRLAEVGCEIVRLAVLDAKAVEALKSIKREAVTPLIADIHFDHRLALDALKAGVDGLRINPGNIGSEKAVAKVVHAAADRKVPIRIGVNSGSLDKDLLLHYGGRTPEAMVESALRQVQLLESLKFHEIKISLKSSDVITMVEAYRLLAVKVSYPLHLGVTEAGTLICGSVKSAIGIGLLLAAGIGDTIRVSLTSDPINEVRAAYEILRALKLRERGIELISCPTCGRCDIDIIGLTHEIEEQLLRVKTPLKVAIMGCVVNGPGEAREADVGIAGGRGQGILFKKGEIVAKIPETELKSRLLEEISLMVDEEIA